MAFAAGASAKSCLGKKAKIVSAKKTIVGSKGPDVIVVLGGGAHTVHGLGGNDRICGGPGDDRLYGEKGSDRIDGGGGDDTILGDRGGDRLSGGAGDDYIDGQKGSDQIEGGGGADHLLGDKGNDTMLGGPGDGDYLDGGLGDEKLEDGGPGNGDEVIGNLGNDNLSGGPGDEDVVRGDGGNDTLDGGGGNHDIASFATAPKPGVVVNLAAGTAGGDGHDKLSHIADVVGSPYNDTLTGDQNANRLDGGPGNDGLDGGPPSGAGDPDLGLGGPGADDCQSFGELSSCNDGSPPQKETAVELNRGLDGTSLVVTGLGDDSQITLSYGGGAFTVTDPTGIETREGSGCVASGAPKAPAPRNPLGIAAAPAPAPAPETTGPDTTATCTSGVGLSFALIDAGGGNDSVAVGSGIPGSLSVRINGGPGNDTLDGGPGDDLIEAGDEYGGTSGSDILNGGGGNDGLIADPGGDQLNGGDGNDLLVSSAAICQGHRFDGGGGLDTVSYARSKPSGTFVIALGKTGAPSGGCQVGQPGHDPQRQREPRGLQRQRRNDRRLGQQHALRAHRRRQLLRDGRQRPDRSDRRPEGQGDRLRPGPRPRRQRRRLDPKPKSC